MSDIHNPVVTVVESTSDDDWEIMLEIFVECFSDYPLYEYFIGGRQERIAFLRLYLRANYEVIAKHRCGLLLVTKLGDGTGGPGKIIGGTLFTTHSKDNSGWTSLSQDVFEEAYQKVGLHKMEGYEKMIRYGRSVCFWRFVKRFYL